MDIPKIKVELDFDDSDKMRRFINKFDPTANEEDDVISNDDSREDSDPDTHEANSKEELGYSDYEEQRYIQNLAKLEESIILKQCYSTQILAIEKSTHARILIVPKKIKYFAKSFDDIEEAKFRVYEILQKINVYSLEKYGKELSESKHYKTMLNSVGVHLGKKAENYYYWYDESTITSQQEVDDIISTVFYNKVHKFYYLNEQAHVSHCISERYMDAIISFNGKFFQEKLKKYMNEDYLIEISESKKSLIIHCDVLEQAAIPEYELKSFYKNIIYFFITYASDDEIENALVLDDDESANDNASSSSP